jgi:hypothetical protein
MLENWHVDDDEDAKVVIHLLRRSPAVLVVVNKAHNSRCLGSRRRDKAKIDVAGDAEVISFRIHRAQMINVSDGNFRQALDN